MATTLPPPNVPESSNSINSKEEMKNSSKEHKKGVEWKISQILVSLGFVLAELLFLESVLRDAENLRSDFAKNPNWYKIDSHNSSSAIRTPWSDIMINAYPFSGTGLYLFSVFVGVQFMKQVHEPFIVDGFMIVYNLYQTLFNLLSVCGFIYVVYRENIPFAGQNFEPTVENDSFWLGFLLYLHYQNKFLELLDTMFMVLRKKNDQLSFLHIEHHTIMVGVWYTVLRNQPGGDPWFGAFANSVIHTLMYAYYLMALLQINCPWKRYITQAQLIQFVACFGQALYVIYLGSTPFWLACVQIAVMTNMLVLFGHFYRSKYAGKSKAEKKED